MREAVNVVAQMRENQHSWEYIIDYARAHWNEFVAKEAVRQVHIWEKGNA